MHLADAARDVGGRDGPPDAPAGDGVRLRQGVDRHRAVLEPRHGRRRHVLGVVDDVLVDLVGEHERVVRLAQLADERELLASEDLARGVVRRVDDDRPRAVGERRTQLGLVDRPVGCVQRDVARRRPRQHGIGAVILVERLEDDHLVTGIDGGEQRGDHGLGRAAGDAELGLGVDRPTGVGLCDLRGDAVAERLRSPGDGVLVDVVVDGRLGRVLELLRAGEVGEALRQVDAAGSRAQARHLADHRLLERAGLRTRPPALRCHASEPATDGRGPASS